jgi:diacylglycerol O-acyltransferase
VTEAVCPPPGNDQALLDLAEALVTRPLSRSLPFWHAWLVKGLAEGGWAIVLSESGKV